MHSHTLTAARVALAAAASPVLLTGCLLAPPRLPAPDAGVRRDAVKPHGERCGMGKCTAAVVVGGGRFRVESRTRLVSPEEATGRPERSVVRRALSAVGGAVLRNAGVGTSALAVGVGTRTVSDPTGTLTLACEVAWVDEEWREKARGGDSTTVTRLAEGMACTAAPPGERAAPRWRFRRGISPTADSLARVLDSPSLGAAGGTSAGAPMILERVARAGGVATQRYSVEPNTSAGPRGGFIAIPVTRWVVRRGDGTVVGALVGSVRPVAAVDIDGAADPEEAAILRLIGACLVPPLAAT
jgi:hypothetical protein